LDGAVIVWFRRDLRLADNPAVAAAAESGRAVIPLFVLDDGADGLRPLGGASKWWLDKSLRALDGALRERGSRLIVRSGASAEILPALAAELGAAEVLWGSTYEPGAERRDKGVQDRLETAGVGVRRFPGSFLNPPGSVVNGSGETYRVFTPYWRAAQAQVGDVRLLAAPDTLDAPEAWPASEPPESWRLHPTQPDWSTGFDWTPGEAAALERLEAFLDEGFARYADARDIRAKQAARGCRRTSPGARSGRARSGWPRTGRRRRVAQARRQGTSC
jgi:deoxyribodipyrimidine photo-lyase